MILLSTFDSDRRAAPETLSSVQIYRAVAVLLVVLFHISDFILSRYAVAPLGNVFRTGFFGVFLFFVISGFIILTAHARDLGRPDRLWYYLSRRFIRIYPFFWAVLMIWGGWRVFTGGIGLLELASNALEFKGIPQLIIPVSWTLRYEIIFYALFVTAILNKPLGSLMFLGWLSLQWGHAPAALMGLVDPLYLLFMFGLGAAIGCFRLQSCSDATRDRLGWLFLMLGLAGFAVTLVLYEQLGVGIDAWPKYPAVILGLGLSSAFLLMASVSVDINRRMGRCRLMALIGNASYAIYLTHIPFGKLAWNLLRPIKPLWQDPPVPWVANLILVWVAVASVLAGILVHLKIEQPLLAALRARLARPAA